MQALHEAISTFSGFHKIASINYHVKGDFANSRQWEYRRKGMRLF